MFKYYIFTLCLITVLNGRTVYFGLFGFDSEDFASIVLQTKPKSLKDSAPNLIKTSMDNTFLDYSIKEPYETASVANLGTYCSKMLTVNLPNYSFNYNRRLLSLSLITNGDIKKGIKLNTFKKLIESKSLGDNMLKIGNVDGSVFVNNDDNTCEFFVGNFKFLYDAVSEKIEKVIDAVKLLANEKNINLASYSTLLLDRFTYLEDLLSGNEFKGEFFKIDLANTRTDIELLSFYSLLLNIKSDVTYAYQNRDKTGFIKALRLGLNKAWKVRERLDDHQQKKMLI